jgi:hemerythrin-like domain-containing protein
MSNANLLRALSVVEEDHQIVLAKMQALRETVQHLLEPGPDGLDRALRRLRDLHAYFVKAFESHMVEEETALFGLLEQRHPTGRDLVARLRQEHDTIRRHCEEFGGSLAVATDLEDRLPRVVVRDLLTYGWEFWEALDQHAYVETQAVHQVAALAAMEEVESAEG